MLAPSKSPSKSHPAKPDSSLIRLQKFLADSGVASRRASEQLIVEGRVTVNGEVRSKLGTKVKTEGDRVTVDGRPVEPKRKLYVAVNKPPGFLCTRKDELSRQTVLDLIPREWDSLFPVGRLDRESEGLIFLTNDGDFSLRLTHPRYGVLKRYRAWVTGKLEPHQLEPLTKGIEHEGDLLKAERVWLLESNNSHTLVEIELSQGKNREIRRMFLALSREVERLQRIQIGPIRLAELPIGKWRVLRDTEVKSLLKGTD